LVTALLRLRFMKDCSFSLFNFSFQYVFNRASADTICRARYCFTNSVRYPCRFQWPWSWKAGREGPIFWRISVPYECC